MVEEERRRREEEAAKERAREAAKLAEVAAAADKKRRDKERAERKERKEKERQDQERKLTSQRDEERKSQSCVRRCIDTLKTQVRADLPGQNPTALLALPDHPAIDVGISKSPSFPILTKMLYRTSSERPDSRMARSHWSISCRGCLRWI